MVDTIPTQAPSLGSVFISYLAGQGETTALLNTEFNISTIPGDANRDIVLEFAHPVQMIIISDYNYPLLDNTGLIFVQSEQPIGKSVLALTNPPYNSPAGYSGVFQSSKFTIRGFQDASDYTVAIKIDYIYNVDNNVDIANSTVDLFLFEGMRNQINDILARLDNNDRFIQDGLTNNLTNLADSNLNLGQNIYDSINASIAAQGQDSRDLATQLTTAFGTNITDFANNLAQTLTGVTGLPLAIIEPLINAIKLLFESEAKNIAEDVNKSFTLNKLPLAEAIRQGNETLNNALQKRGDVINKLLSGQYKSLDDFYKDFNTSGANVGILQTLQNTFTIAYLLFTYLKARTQTSEIVLSQLMLSQDTPNLNDINTNVLAYLRGFKTYEQLATDLAKYGLDKNKVNELLTTRSLLTSLNDIKAAFQRGLIDETQHDTLLSQYGIAPGNIQLIKDVYPLLPSPTDITRMADKHIFAPDIPQIFGQNSEVDDGYLKSMELWGIDEQWTRKLWASHWSLPGLQETFDLWHRGLISDSELDTFFKLTDILPFFREKLKLLSHNLIGRVDIRRFYHVGVYTQQDVYNAFIRLGFSEADAQKQTQFTIENDRQSDLPKHVKIRALTESMVVKAFKEGIISEQDAINRLGTVGYLPADASLILALETQTANIGKTGDKTELYHNKVVSLILKSYADGVISRTDAKNSLTQIGIPSGQADIELYYSEIERIVHLKSLVINHVRSAYTKGQIDKAGATNLMLTHGFGMSEIELLFEELDISKSLRSKELSLVQVEKLLKAGIITVSQFAQELANMGYNDTHIGWLLQEIVGV